MSNVNAKARQIVEKVREEFGYTFEEMAELCGVATGSVQRWYSSGRAKADKIKALEELLANTNLPEHKIAENLIKIYWHIKWPIKIIYSQLRDISGRERLCPNVIERIRQELYERGFAFVDDTDEEGKLAFFLLRKQWLSKHTKAVNEAAVKAYYLKGVELESAEEDETSA
ncbi:hypothetical protein [uncultured Thiodictyon sp.]|uniref:hypothetical protein n=1 Tax=uncultured Thiodictyon sp. TaxID=1846217 RepID=UPI0025DF666C|nr:hypothetical protein [uncultured Thiodictyon sp.]